MFNFGFGMFYLHIHQPREHHFDLHSSCIHFHRKLLFRSENKCNPIFIHSWRYKIFCSSSNCSCLPSISCSNRLSHSNIVSTTITDKFLVWLSIAVPSANFLTISPTILTLQTQSLWCGLSTDLFQFCGRPNCPTDFNERSNCAVKPKLAACHFKLSPPNLWFTLQVSTMHIVHCTSPVNTMFTSSLTQLKSYIKHQLPSLQG